MNPERLARIRAKKRQAANVEPVLENDGLDVVIGKNKILGGFDVKRSDGAIVKGARSQTNAAMGRGKVVSTYRGNRQTLVDAKPVGSVRSTNNQSGTNAASATNGGRGVISGSTNLGGAGGNASDGSKPRYRPDPETGECTAKYYLGETKAGDYDTPQECAGSQENSKSYYCEGGKCYATAAGSGRYNDLASCEAAIVPGFSGGQCEGVNYTIKASITATATNAEGTANLGTATSDIEEASNATNLVGKISSIRINPIYDGVVFSGSGIFTSVIKAVGSSGTNTSGVVSFTGSGYAKDFKIATLQIIRSDGLPDDCGDMPGSCPL